MQGSRFKICTATIHRALKEKRSAGISLKTHLRRHGKKTMSDKKNFSTIHPPEIVETRGLFGDFEGDAVYGGVGKGCEVTFVDRKSKLLTASIVPNREKRQFEKLLKKLLH